jgi:hypothetical protein
VCHSTSAPYADGVVAVVGGQRSNTPQPNLHPAVIAADERGIEACSDAREHSALNGCDKAPTTEDGSMQPSTLNPEVERERGRSDLLNLLYSRVGLECIHHCLHSPRLSRSMLPFPTAAAIICLP